MLLLGCVISAPSGTLPNMDSMTTGSKVCGHRRQQCLGESERKIALLQIYDFIHVPYTRHGACLPSETPGDAFLCLPASSSGAAGPSCLGAQACSRFSWDKTLPCTRHHNNVTDQSSLTRNASLASVQDLRAEAYLSIKTGFTEYYHMQLHHWRAYNL